MGSTGLIILGLAAIIAITAIIVKIIENGEKANEREYAIKLRKCEMPDENTD